jgi:formimidoylglutamate deiminase
MRLPALATAHSHAFQRALRGKTQRPGPAGSDDFWSWRKAMYDLAESLTPESIHSISKVAYEELYRAGVRTVGEFHYVHHQSNGVPYSNRNELAEAVIRAAREAGLRIGLLRVIYARAGAGRPPEGAQRRFCDANLEQALSDIDDLKSRYANDSNVVVGVAPHSVRAVPPDWLEPIALFAKQAEMPIHMHVAEQLAEIDACLAETGKRPVELLADRGALGPRFVAVHATHLASHEARLLGDAKAFACLCPTTERDLGDGLPDVGALVANSVRLATGIDSHVITAPLEDLRGIELGERLRTRKRVVLPIDTTQSPAQYLWNVGSHETARAAGFADAGGEIGVDLASPDLALVPDELLLDSIVYSGGASLFNLSKREIDDKD